MTAPKLVGPRQGERATETRIYAVGALKGGTGKTRLAMLIALILRVVFGYRVVVFDADSGSQTSSNWPVKAKLREYAWDIEVIRHPFDTLDKEIDKIRERGDVDFIIVDVGGGNVAAFQAAVKRAHKLLVPLCPDEGDLEQAPKTRDAALMAASRNPFGCQMYYVLSRCGNDRDKIDSRSVLLDVPETDEDGPYPLLDTDIPSLVAYKRAFGRIPQMKGSSTDPDCPRWKDLVGFVPMMLETEILTVEQVLSSGLMTKREVAAHAPMLLAGEVITDEQALELGLMTEGELAALQEEVVS
jgi:cellulose biosynthesis protein BcsQ